MSAFDPKPTSRRLAANDPKQPSIAHPKYILGSKLQCPNWSKAVADLKDLLGTWTMLSWKKEIIATGQIVDALGPDPVGYITYGTDGRMHAIVLRRDRLAPETLPPTATEKLRLFDSMLAYSGTYTLDDEKVIHHVDVSWNQTFTKTALIRFYNLANSILTITAAPAIDPYSGKEVIHRMEFRKA
jgi:Lipocalin-like domain